jgi:hypothetical protein
MLDDIWTGYMALSRLRTTFWEMGNAEGCAWLCDIMCSVAQVIDTFDAWPGGEREG